ncbi:MAG: flagellar motor protein MotD [Steroidobacteraceae bacterium]
MSRKPVMTRRRRRHEEHTNHEAWAIPYGDLVTLLLAFFVVMYAISSVNAGKYRVLSDSLFAAFRGTPRTMEPIEVGAKQAGSGAQLESAVVHSALNGQQRSSLAPVPVEGDNKAVGQTPIWNRLPPRSAAAGAAGTAAAGAPGAAAAALARVADEVEHAMDDLVKQNLVVIRRTDFWIEVEIRTDILFPSGSAHLAAYAVDVIQRLAGALAPFPNPIRVEGHTDNKPINTVAFYSNWELSAARAGSVVRVLQGRGVSPDRLAVIGFGDQRPVQPNDTEQGRNANRRVVVVILSTELQRHKDPADPPGILNSIALSTPTPAAVPAGATAALQPSAAPTTSPTGASPSSPSTPASAHATLASPGEPAQFPLAVATPVSAAAPANVTLSTSGAHAAGNGMVPAP